MPQNEEDEARATHRFVEAATGETVGFVYEWEDGSKQPLWFDGERFDVVTVEISGVDLSGKD